MIKIEQMVNENDMLEFFIEHHKTDLELTKMHMFHGFQSYCKKLREYYEEKTKGMSKEEKKLYYEELEEEDSDDEFESVCDTAHSEVMKEYGNRFDLEHEDMDIILTDFDKYFTVTLRATVYDSEKKFSEHDFEVELNDDAHFLIDLVNFLILESE
jgi:bifunctional DNA-binding transcriptional regulator/antitoxin component of YhaV-PrlF toxin-antitoxin module